MHLMYEDVNCEGWKWWEIIEKFPCECRLARFPCECRVASLCCIIPMLLNPPPMSLRYLLLTRSYQWLYIANKHCESLWIWNVLSFANWTNINCSQTASVGRRRLHITIPVHMYFLQFYLWNILKCSHLYLFRPRSTQYSVGELGLTHYGHQHVHTVAYCSRWLIDK